MDINMTKQGDLETTIEIKKMRPHIKVLMLTQYEDKEYITRFSRKVCLAICSKRPWEATS